MKHSPYNQMPREDLIVELAAWRAKFEAAINEELKEPRKLTEQLKAAIEKELAFSNILKAKELLKKAVKRYVLWYQIEPTCYTNLRKALEDVKQYNEKKSNN